MLHKESERYLSAKKDCINYNGKECMTLKKTYCRKESECKFYRSMEQYEAQIAGIKERIPSYAVNGDYDMRRVRT